MKTCEYGWTRVQYNFCTFKIYTGNEYSCEELRKNGAEIYVERDGVIISSLLTSFLSIKMYEAFLSEDEDYAKMQLEIYMSSVNNHVNNIKNVIDGKPFGV